MMSVRLLFKKFWHILKTLDCNSFSKETSNASDSVKVIDSKYHGVQTMFFLVLYRFCYFLPWFVQTPGFTFKWSSQAMLASLP